MIKYISHQNVQGVKCKMLEVNKIYNCYMVLLDIVNIEMRK
jgi:hypothetical protein